MTTKINALYTAHAKANGGREGTAASDDNRLSVKLSTPQQLGGAGGEGTNPEQLFAAGYAACFIGALKAVGAQKKIKVPNEVSIESSVGIGQIPGGYGLEVELKVDLPGIDDAVAADLITTAHGVCPYSNATRGNIEVTLIHKSSTGDVRIEG